MSFFHPEGGQQDEAARMRPQDEASKEALSLRPNDNLCIEDLQDGFNYIYPAFFGFEQHCPLHVSGARPVNFATF